MTPPQVVPLRPDAISPRLEVTVATFLDRERLDDNSRRTYGYTLTRLVGLLGADTPVAAVTRDQLAAAAAAGWPDVAPATWNRVVATIGSLFAFAVRRGWLVDDPSSVLERRREVVDHDRAVPLAQLEALWSRDDVGLREKTLWRLLWETAARANEVLALDVDDLDLRGHRARIVRKGGDRDVIHWQAGAARLLPRLLAGRTTGPVFLSAIAPQPRHTPALADRDPASGRARLSYRRAAAMIEQHSGGRWTLHQLRHSALSHLADQGASTTLLMRKSGHTSLASLQRYARPSVEAVARLTADHDPARRQPRT